MRKIQRTISLEPMTSRLPSVIPSYMDNKLYYFDDNSLKDRQYSYTSNYGMIPTYIKIPDQYNDKICGVKSILGDCKVISFERLSKWYYKFKEYYHLLNDYGHCNTVYKSAVDYYYHESSIINPNKINNVTNNGFNILLYSDAVEITSFNSYQYMKGKGVVEIISTAIIPSNGNSIDGEEIEKLEISGKTNDNEIVTVVIDLDSVLPNRIFKGDLVYGNDLQTYIDLDEEFKCMGGEVDITSAKTTMSCDNKEVTKVIEAHDTSFYNWICENVIPTYTIPNEYQEYWGKQTLFYPNVIEWIGWFEENSKYSACTDEKQCSDISENCCECVEYVKRGGKKVYDDMKSWYEEIQSKIPKPSDSSSCSTPYIIMPIELQNSIDDLGEMSIFCEEYEDGVDYRTIKTESGESKTIIHYESGNTHGGTIVIKDNTAIKLKGDSLGYSFNDDYMEYGFDEDSWRILSGESAQTYVSGSTTSRLKSLFRQDYLVDDIGNTIEGLYNLDSEYYAQPPIGSTLEPLYQIGNVANLVSVEGEDNIFFGDEIEDMIFYYLDYNNELVGNKVSSNGSSLSAIMSATSSVSNSDTIYQEDIFCDIIYSVGNTYKLLNGNTSEETLQLMTNGVRYQETVQFVKTKVEYYLKNKNKKATPNQLEEPSMHSVSYPIYIYKLRQIQATIDNSTYNVSYDDNIAYFGYSGKTYNSDSGETIVPLIREEYKLGISAPQNVESDIYIDRGINSAFEKHIKLGEIKSMEALIQYGLGYFKIMDN